MTAKSMYPKAPVAAVGAFVFKDDAVLLVKRGNPPAKGNWAIPGGRILLGESLAQAAEREIFEETGLIIRAGKPAYTFDAVIKDEDGGISFHYVIVDLLAEYVAGEIRSGDDADDARWVKASEFAGMDINPRTRSALKELFDFG